MTDIDGDGYGTDTPLGLAVSGTDCDDTDDTVAPFAGLCPVGDLALMCLIVILNSV